MTSAYCRQAAAGGTRLGHAGRISAPAARRRARFPRQLRQLLQVGRCGGCGDCGSCTPSRHKARARRRLIQSPCPLNMISIFITPRVPLHRRQHFRRIRSRQTAPPGNKARRGHEEASLKDETRATGTGPLGEQQHGPSGARAAAARARALPGASRAARIAACVQLALGHGASSSACSLRSPHLLTPAAPKPAPRRPCRQVPVCTVASRRVSTAGCAYTATQSAEWTCPPWHPDRARGVP